MFCFQIVWFFSYTPILQKKPENTFMSMSRKSIPGLFHVHVDPMEVWMELSYRSCPYIALITQI